jgi:hypothetical protein
MLATGTDAPNARESFDSLGGLGYTYHIVITPAPHGTINTERTHILIAHRDRGYIGEVG